MESYLITLAIFLQNQFDTNQCCTYFTELKTLVDNNQWFQTIYACRAGLECLFAIHTRDQFDDFLQLFNKYQYSSIADKDDTMNEADLKETSALFADLANITYPFHLEGGCKMTKSKSGRTFLDSLQKRKKLEPISLLPPGLDMLSDDSILEQMILKAPHLFGRSAETLQNKSRRSLNRLYKQQMNAFNRAILDGASIEDVVAVAEQTADIITGESAPKPIARRGPSSKITFNVEAVIEWSRGRGVIFSFFYTLNPLLFYMQQSQLKGDEDGTDLVDQIDKAPVYQLIKRPSNSSQIDAKYTLRVKDQTDATYVVAMVNKKRVVFRLKAERYEVGKCTPVRSVHKAEVHVYEVKDREL